MPVFTGMTDTHTRLIHFFLVLVSRIVSITSLNFCYIMDANLAFLALPMSHTRHLNELPQQPAIPGDWLAHIHQP